MKRNCRKTAMLLVCVYLYQVAAQMAVTGKRVRKK